MAAGRDQLLDPGAAWKVMGVLRDCSAPEATSSVFPQVVRLSQFRRAAQPMAGRLALAALRLPTFCATRRNSARDKAAPFRRFARRRRVCRIPSFPDRGGDASWPSYREIWEFLMSADRCVLCGDRLGVLIDRIWMRARWMWMRAQTKMAISPLWRRAVWRKRKAKMKADNCAQGKVGDKAEGGGQSLEGFYENAGLRDRRFWLDC